MNQNEEKGIAVTEDKGLDKVNESLDAIVHKLGAIDNKLTNVTNLLELQEQEESHNYGGKVVEEAKLKDATIRVREFSSSCIGDLAMATGIYHAQKLGMRLRRLEVDLRDGELAFDGGMFQSSTGDIKFGKVSLNPVEMVRGAVRKANAESFFRPTVRGQGTVLLESSFKFIKLLRIKTESKIVLEKGLYLASAGDFKFKTTTNLNLSYLAFSKKAMFQTDVRGRGILALELPVHPDELEKHDVIPGRSFRVDGDYVLYWVGDLKRTVRPSNNVLGSLTNSAGLVEEYTGSGYVVTAPTLGYYKEISMGSGFTIQNTAGIGKRKKVGFFKRLLGKGEDQENQ